jgi:hypothetical protein
MTCIILSLCDGFQTWNMAESETGHNEDPFEHRQVRLAEERLGKLGLRIERLPGGHLTTNEQPNALATLITNFERGL